MTAAPFMLVPLILVTAVSSGYAAELPDSAERLLLRLLHAQKIIAVHDLRRRTIDEFEYLGFFGTFEVNWSFESWYHPQVILRKTRTDADWSHAELFYSRQRIGDLFALPDAQFQKALVPRSSN